MGEERRRRRIRRRRKTPPHQISTVKISEVLSKLHSKIMKGCIMAQAVSRWPLTAEAWVSPRGMWWKKWHRDRVFP
jgi:hypothetical protein